LEQKKEDNGEAIARSMLELSKLKVPVIAIIIGEGSSGGALALGVGNKVFMLENAIYSILSPEGYSSILWKDSSRYKEAAERMKLTAQDLYEFNVIDKVIPESTEINDNNFKETATSLKNEILNSLIELNKLTKEEIVENRYKKFRKMGGI
jgi:acetyl-CoA carboxylase carboxyl transferase alpha subunit